MRDHFLVTNDVKEIIYDLSYKKNYLNGPEEDRDGYTGTIWVFKCEYDEMIIYIKIRYDDPNVVCISIHEDEPF